VKVTARNHNQEKKNRQLKKFDQEGTEGHITEIHARHNWE
jgi:hypothetical protein